MSTIYSPFEHQDKIVRAIRLDAMAKKEHFDRKTTGQISNGPHRF